MTCSFPKLVAINLAIIAATMALPDSLHAQPPDVIHYFAELSFNTSQPCTDFEANDSRRVVAHKGGPQSAFKISILGDDHPAFVGEEERYRIRDEDGDLLLDLFNTKWVIMPIVHVTDNGAEQIENILWLQEEQPENNARPGTTSKTGPNGNVFGIKTIWVSQLSSSDSYYPNHWHVTSPEAATAKLCISVGFFNK